MVGRQRLELWTRGLKVCPGLSTANRYKSLVLLFSVVYDIEEAVRGSPNAGESWAALHEKCTKFSGAMALLGKSWRPDERPPDNHGEGPEAPARQRQDRLPGAALGHPQHPGPADPQGNGPPDHRSPVGALSASSTPPSVPASLSAADRPDDPNSLLLAAKALVFCGFPYKRSPLTTITREAQLGADTHLTVYFSTTEPGVPSPSAPTAPSSPGSPPLPTTPASSTSPA
jgi:hypothetical protein